MKRNESTRQAEGMGQGQGMTQQDRGQELPGHVSSSGRLGRRGGNREG